MIKRTPLLINIILISFNFFIGCSSNTASSEELNPFENRNSIEKTDSSTKTSIDENKLKVYLKQQDDVLSDLNNELDNLREQIEAQNKLLEETQVKFEDKYNELKANQIVEKKEPQIDVTNSLIKMKNKVKILEDRAFYTDSLYFEIVNDLVQIENKILSLTTSYKEMIELKTSGTIKELPPISDEEYTARYIEALSSYQNGEWNKSLEGFTYLISVNSNHDLADNCQYWVGEVYYSLKNYKRSINEFENVFSFPGTNKADDAQYKLGLCYINIGNKVKAAEEFKRLIEYYPNSEYFKKSQQYINQLY